MMKLITEISDPVRYSIEEGANGAKKYYISGPFAVAEQKNQNGRIYPIDTLKGACQKFQNVIESNRAFGELGHPQGPAINLDRVSHIIKSMKYVGEGIFEGKAHVIDTPNGVTVQKLLDAGASLGVSTRGMGSLVTKESYQEVQPDFHLATVDIVADPSAPGAFVQGIMEGKEWVLREGSFQEVDLIREQRYLNESVRKKNLEEAAIKAFQRWVNSI